MVFDALDPSEIAHWADMPNAFHKLPELIWRLVLATVPMPPSRIDVRSGSSVRLSGWDGLLVVQNGNPWVPSGASAWEFSCEAKPKGKATDEYKKRTDNPKGVDVPNTTFVFVTPRRWGGKREWIEDRQAEGLWADVLALDADDLVMWIEQDLKVKLWFARVIGKLHASEIISLEERLAPHYRSDEARPTLANRQKALHIGAGSHVNAGLDALEEPTETAETENLPDPAHRALAEKIDFARDLINTGLVRSAREELERLKDQDGSIPVELEFRILTNLGACALAEEDSDGARAFLEQAYRLQPDNTKAIANAALAAGLGKNFERAIALALKARTRDPQDSQATAVLMEAYFEASQDDLLEELVASEEWITCDKQCRLTLARIRNQQSRFEESATLCRSLIIDDCEDPLAQLTLSETLLNHSDSESLVIGLTEESRARLHDAEDAASAAIDLLSPHKLEAQRRRALVIRAVIRKFLGATSQAMGDLDEVLAAVPWHPDAAFHKGLLLFAKASPKMRVAVFEGIQDPGRRADAVLPLSEACLASGDPAAAIGLLKGTVNFECPKWHDISRAEVLCLAEIAVGDEDSLGSALELALERHAQNPRVLTIAALRHKHLGNSEEAERLLLGALEYAREPDRHEILAQLGGLYEKMGRFTEAADRFAEVVEDVVSHPHAIHLLGCLVKSRRLREALEWARKDSPDTSSAS